MIFLFKYFYINQFRRDTPNIKYLLYQAITTLFSVWVYYMTAKSLTVRADGELNWYGFDYFHFLIIGEAAMLLPHAAMESHSKVVRLLMHVHLKKELLRNSLMMNLKKLWVLSTAQTNTVWLQFLFYVFSAALFQSQIQVQNLVMGMAYVILFIPCFMILGHGFGGLVLMTGRGQGITEQLMFLLQVLAGVYFPIEVFGNWAVNLKLYLPHTFFLNGIRQVMAGEFSSQIWIEALQFQIVFTLVFSPISIFIFHLARSRVKKNSEPQIIFS